MEVPGAYPGEPSVMEAPRAPHQASLEAERAAAPRSAPSDMPETGLKASEPISQLHTIGATGSGVGEDQTKPRAFPLDIGEDMTTRAQQTQSTKPIQAEETSLSDSIPTAYHGGIYNTVAGHGSPGDDHDNHHGLPERTTMTDTNSTPSDSRLGGSVSSYPSGTVYNTVVGHGSHDEHERRSHSAESESAYTTSKPGAAVSYDSTMRNQDPSTTTANRDASGHGNEAISASVPVKEQGVKASSAAAETRREENKASHSHVKEGVAAGAVVGAGAVAAEEAEKHKRTKDSSASHKDTATVDDEKDSSPRGLISKVLGKNKGDKDESSNEKAEDKAEKREKHSGILGVLPIRSKEDKSDPSTAADTDRAAVDHSHKPQDTPAVVGGQSTIQPAAGHKHEHSTTTTTAVPRDTLATGSGSTGVPTSHAHDSTAHKEQGSVFMLNKPMFKKDKPEDEGMVKEKVGSVFMLDKHTVMKPASEATGPSAQQSEFHPAHTTKAAPAGAGAGAGAATPLAAPMAGTSHSRPEDTTGRHQAIENPVTSSKPDDGHKNDSEKGGFLSGILHRHKDGKEDQDGKHSNDGDHNKLRKKSLGETTTATAAHPTPTKSAEQDAKDRKRREEEALAAAGVGAGGAAAAEHHHRKKEEAVKQDQKHESHLVKKEAAVVAPVSKPKQDLAEDETENDQHKKKHGILGIFSHHKDNEKESEVSKHTSHSNAEADQPASTQKSDAPKATAITAGDAAGVAAATSSHKGRDQTEPSHSATSKNEGQYELLSSGTPSGVNKETSQTGAPYWGNISTSGQGSAPATRATEMHAPSSAVATTATTSGPSETVKQSSSLPAKYESTNATKHHSGAPSTVAAAAAGVGATEALSRETNTTTHAPASGAGTTKSGDGYDMSRSGTSPGMNTDRGSTSRATAPAPQSLGTAQEGQYNVMGSGTATGINLDNERAAGSSGFASEPSQGGMSSTASHKTPSSLVGAAGMTSRAMPAEGAETTAHGLGSQEQTVESKSFLPPSEHTAAVTTSGNPAAKGRDTGNAAVPADAAAAAAATAWSSSAGPASGQTTQTGNDKSRTGQYEILESGTPSGMRTD